MIYHINNEKDFVKVVESKSIYKIENEKAVKLFLSTTCSFKRFIIGKNEESKNIIKTFKIDGVIDDFAKTNYWNDVPIIKSTEIGINAIVVNCSTSISPIEVKEKIFDLGIQYLINLSDLLNYDDIDIPLPVFVSEMRLYWQNNKSTWYGLYKKLNDEISKEILIDLISYRLSANISIMNNYKVRLSDQYFEKFMNYNEETYVDIGGFDGDTSELFCLNDKKYKQIFLFEPSSINMEAARKRLINYKNINFCNLGLSNKKEELYFNESAGSSSSISANGSIKISTSTLDDEVKEKVSVIKMDIEGWELNALKGSQKHIINDNPKLAITVYHNAKDFIEIPNFILSINPNYSLYLRHYTSGWSETVMYFVPTN